MKHITAACALVSLLFAPPVTAGVQDLAPWLTLATACESLVTDQDTALLETFPAADPFMAVDDYRSITAGHAQAPVIAQAYGLQTGWFMCIVAARPELKFRQAKTLLRGWQAAQDAFFTSPQYRPVSLRDRFVVDPVRVQCHDNGRYTAVFAYFTPERGFRIGVVNTLPTLKQSPC